MTSEESQSVSSVQESNKLRSEAAGNTSPGISDEITLGKVLHAIRKRIWLAIAILLVFVFGAVAFGLSQTKIYRASTVLQIDPTPPRPLGGGVENVVEMGTGSYWGTLEYYSTQHQLISSKAVTFEVAKELGLHHDQAFMANLPTTPEGPPQEYTIEQAARAVASRLGVFPTKESRLVEVTIDDPDPKRAVRILEAVLRAFFAHNMNQVLDSNSSAVEWLGEQLETLRGELEQSELSLHQYKLEKQIPSLGIQGQTNILKQEMEQLSAERTTVRAKIQSASARLAQLNKIEQGGDPESIPQMEILRREQLQLLREEYLSATSQIQRLFSSGKGENHPDVQALSGQVKVTRDLMQREVENIRQGAQQELAALQQEEAGLTGLLQAAEAKALELNLMEIEYARLRRTMENNEKLYSVVLERSKEANLTQMLKVNNIHVIDPPAPVAGAVEPRMALIVALGGALGLVFGLGAAILRERQDSTVKSLEDLEHRLNLVPLGAVPALDRGRPAAGRLSRPGRRSKPAESSPERTVFLSPKSAFAEAVRAVRTNILFMLPDRPTRRLLIASAGPSEGKTTVACCLGEALAQAGQRVLLVDCDMRRPRLHAVFPQGGSERSTLSQSLLEPRALDRATLRTDVPNLDVLPSGVCPPNPAELLQSETFSHLLDRLSQHYDWVLLDSPPLVVTDAAILSTKVDGVVLVVRAYETDVRSANRAARAIRDVGGRIIGGILNVASPVRGGYGYEYAHSDVYSTPDRGDAAA